MAELPSPTDIAALKTSLEKYWGGRLSLDKEERDFINGEHMIEAPDTRVLGMEPEAVTLGIGAEVVRHIKGLFPYGNYIVAPQGKGPAELRHAEQVASWLNAVTQALEDDCGDDTRDLRDDDVISHGRGGTVTLPLFKRYTDDFGYPKQDDGESDKDFNKRVAMWKKTAALPISHRHYPIVQCLPLRSGKHGIRKAIIKSMESGADIKENWPDSAFAQAMKPAQAANRYEILLYLDEEWCAYVWTGHEGQGGGSGGQPGEILDSWQHKMGVCPFNLTVGEITPDPDPKHHYKSRIYDLMPLAVARDKISSRGMTMIKVQALVPPIFKTKEVYSQGAEMPNRKIEMKNDGNPVSLFADEELAQPLQYPLQPEVEAMDEKLREQIQRHSYTDVIAGIGGSDQSGIHFLYRSKAAQNVFTPLGQHLADGTRRDGQMLLRAVIALGEEVAVRRSTKDGVEDVSLTPDLAQRFLNDIHVDRTPVFPEDESRDLDNVGKATQMGYPWPKAWQRFGHETEPENLFEESLICEYLTGAGKEALQQEALRRADLLQAQEETMLPAELAETMPNLPPGLQRALVQPEMPPGSIPEGVPPMPPAPMGAMAQ